MRGQWIVPGKAAPPPPLTSTSDTSSLASSIMPGEPRDILLVMPAVPYPAVWGFARRCLQLATILAQSHRVTILTYALPDQYPDVIALANRVHEVIAVIRREPGGAVRRLRQVQSVGSGLPHHAYGLRSDGMQEALNTLLARRRFAVVQFESSQMAWLKVPPGPAVIVDEHNIESDLLRRVSQSEESVVRRTYNAIESRRYEEFEKTVWSRASGCVTTSVVDAESLQARAPSVPVVVAPNGVDPDDFAPSGQPAQADRIVFTGLLGYRPNLDGIRWFLDEVFPSIRKARPGAQLMIVGNGDPDVLRSLRRPGVEVTGRVPLLQPYIESASVVVVPLRMGGGTRLKIVEAMSMQKAIVSTGIGAEGIDVHPGRDIVLAEDPREFAQAVLALLADPARCADLGRHARRLAAEKYSWQASADRLRHFYREFGPGVRPLLAPVRPSQDRQVGDPR